MSNDNTIRNIVYERQTQTHTQTQTRQWFSLEVNQKNNKIKRNSRKGSNRSKGSKYIANVKTLYPKIEIQINIEHPS